MKQMGLLGYLWVSMEIGTFDGVDVTSDISDESRIQRHPSMKFVRTAVEESAQQKSKTQVLHLFTVREVYRSDHGILPVQKRM